MSAAISTLRHGNFPARNAVTSISARREIRDESRNFAAMCVRLAKGAVPGE
jgi:hypothetical protein